MGQGEPGAGQRRLGPPPPVPPGLQPAPPRPAEEATLLEAAELFWRSCSSRSTLEEYRGCTLRLCRAWERRGARLCSQLSPELVLRLQAEQGHLQATTRRHRAYVLRLFLRLLERCQWCRPGLSALVSIPPLPLRYPGPAMALPDQRSLLGAGGDARSRALCWLLLGTGARIGELLSCSWGDLDGEILFLCGKSGVRGVPLSDGCRAALGEYLGGRGRYRSTAPLISGRQGPLSRRQATTLLHQACQRAGLPPVSPHRLRHAAAARWLSHGIPVVVVAQMLGHRRPSTTLDHYSSATASDLLRGLSADPLWEGAGPVP
ncbi:MAG: tyrosine-type recombinase/integrase [Candidatus Dormibacteria bacterium]